MCNSHEALIFLIPQEKNLNTWRLFFFLLENRQALSWRAMRHHAVACAFDNFKLQWCKGRGRGERGGKSESWLHKTSS